MFYKVLGYSDIPKKYATRMRCYIDSAKKRGYVFKISPNHFYHLVTSNCHFCGSEPKLDSSNVLRNGVDRIDNSKGYIKGNVMTCCSTCNKMKGVLGNNEFIAHVAKINENMGKIIKVGKDSNNPIILYNHFKNGKYLPFYNLFYLVESGLLSKDEVLYDVASTVHDFKEESINILAEEKRKLSGKQFKSIRKSMTLSWLKDNIKKQWELL